MKWRKSLGMFVSRREYLVPNWKGWLLLGLLGITLLVIGVLRVHPFLARTAPVPAEVLVVEGWVPDYVLEEARVEFEQHRYGRLYVTGGPLETGGHLSGYKTYAALGAATLIRMGMTKDVIEAVPAPPVGRDRTFTSAVALKNRLRQRGTDKASINLVSLGAHARRSRLLFQKAFGEDSRVGIIAIEDQDYDPRHWWQSSQGVRTVVDELVAYMYVLVVFPFV